LYRGKLKEVSRKIAKKRYKEAIFFLGEVFRGGPILLLAETESRTTPSLLYSWLPERVGREGGVFWVIPKIACSYYSFSPKKSSTIPEQPQEPGLTFLNHYQLNSGQTGLLFSSVSNSVSAN